MEEFRLIPFYESKSRLLNSLAGSTNIPRALRETRTCIKILKRELKSKILPGCWFYAWFVEKLGLLLYEQGDNKGGKRELQKSLRIYARAGKKSDESRVRHLLNQDENLIRFAARGSHTDAEPPSEQRRPPFAIVNRRRNKLNQRGHHSSNCFFWLIPAK